MSIRDNIKDEEENGEPIPLSSLKPKEEQDTEIEIDIKKKQTDNKATFSIKNPNFIKDFVAEPTRNSEDYGKSSSSSSASAPSSPSPEGETVADIRKRLEQEEKEEVSKLSVEDFEDMADFIIDLIDMGILFGIRWYSQDISDAEYKVPEEKLKKLKKHLSRLLMRVGKKFPMGILFALGILAAYATPMRKAHEHRKKVTAEKTRKKLVKMEVATTSKEEEEEKEEGPEYIPVRKRKKQGGQPK
jgi:uncharacterized protein (DUF2164 family)